MNNRTLKVLGLLLALSLLLGLGVVVARATVRAQEPDQQLAESGIVIASVVPQGPAGQAGLVRGDILLEIDGQSVDSRADLSRYLDGLEAGDEVELLVLHGDEQRSLRATLDERAGASYLGVTPCGCDNLGPRPKVDVARPMPGAIVFEVVPDSPAERAGLQEGDLVQAVDGREVGLEDDLSDLIASYQPGDRVELTVWRFGESEELELEATLAEHPNQPGQAYLGVGWQPSLDLHPFWHDLKPLFPMPQEDWAPREDSVEGVVVRRVLEDSPAAAAGLVRGDVIVAVDGEPVSELEALVDTIASRQPGDSLSLTLLANQENRQVEVSLGEHPDRPGVAYLGVILNATFHRHRFQDPDGGFHPMRPFFEGEEWPFDVEPPALEGDEWPFESAPRHFGPEEPGSHDDSA